MERNEIIDLKGIEGARLVEFMEYIIDLMEVNNFGNCSLSPFSRELYNDYFK